MSVTRGEDCTNSRLVSWEGAVKRGLGCGITREVESVKFGCSGHLFLWDEITGFKISHDTHADVNVGRDNWMGTPVLALALTSSS